MTQSRETILEDRDLKNLYLKMLDYLGRGDMSEERLIMRITRLRQRYPTTERYTRYTRENCLLVIPLLREDGYIDELRFARRVVSGLRDKKDGAQMIRKKLVQRDVHPKIINQVLDELNSNPQDLSIITGRAEQKYQQLLKKENRTRGYQARVRQKLYAWLGGRGFSSKEITSIVSSVIAEDSGFHE